MCSTQVCMHVFKTIYCKIHELTTTYTHKYLCTYIHKAIPTNPFTLLVQALLDDFLFSVLYAYEYFIWLFS